MEEKTPLPVAQQPTSPQRGVVGRTGFPNELHLFPLLLGLIWLTLFGPATEMNTYSVLAPVAAVLCVVGVFNVEAWFGTLLLVVAVVRGAFPQEWGQPLHTLQPLGALLLLAALVPDFKKKDADDAEKSADEEDRRKATLPADPLHPGFDPRHPRSSF